MKVLKIKNYSIEESATKVVDLIKDAAGDTVAEEVAIQVSDDCTIEITGRTIDEDGVEFEPVSLINAATLKVVDKITAKGTYLLPVEALSSITLDITGTVDVIIKVLA